MKLLKQNHHGLPGIGVNGKKGNIGETGNSIYFGFINDFFDGEILNVDTYVYVAKRMLENGEDLDISTLNAAWAVTCAELHKYDTDDVSLFKIVNNSSNNTDAAQSYVNFKTSYYTGNRFTDDFRETIDIYREDANLAKSVKLDIDGDFISMSFMLSSIDNNLNEIEQYHFEKDKTPSMDFDKNDNISAKYENIISRTTHYQFENGAGLFLNINGQHIWPYDINDAIYNSNKSVGLLYESGNFLDNINASLYYYNWPENTNITYVKEDIPSYSGYTYYAVDSNLFYAFIDVNNNLYSVNRINPNKYRIIDDSVVNKWNQLYKLSQKINTLNSRTIYNEDDILDYQNNAFYGIPNSILFDRENNMVSFNSDVFENTFYSSNFIKYYQNDPELYSNNVNVMVNTNDGMHVFYSLNDSDTQIYIPFNLKSKYKQGDTLYFYTNKTEFNNTHNIEYMVVIDDQLINCTPTQLINAATLTNPLSIKLFNNIISDRVNNLYNIGVLYNQNSDNNEKLLSNRSFISIIDKYSTSPLLISAKTKFNTLNVNNNNQNKSLKTYIKNNMFILDVNDENEISLKMSKLYMNTNKITDKTNVELKNLVYNPIIKLYDNNFIKPLSDINLFFDNNYQSVFIQKIDANDYFYNLDNISNYFYGCDIYNKEMEKIKTISSSDTTFDVEIIPFVENNTYYIQMFAMYNGGLKYYSKLSKLTITYSKTNINKNIVKNLNTFNDKIKKISNTAKYSKSIGVFSAKSQITSYKIEIIGDDQNIIKEKYSGNIIFDMSDITSEIVQNASLHIYSDNENIQIIDVMFNHLNNFVNDTITVNDWSRIQKENVSTYSLDISSNLPIFTNEGTKNTLIEYLETGKSVLADGELIIEAPIFSELNNGNKVKDTKQRSILVTVKYKFDNSNECYYENFNIVQPGFSDTRDLPIVKLDIEQNFQKLEKINSISNNVLSNQFVTYLNIDIKDFKKQWGKFITNDTNITLDINIANITYDIDWQNKYVINKECDRRTFKIINESDDVSILNNYVKFDMNIDESTLDLSYIDISSNQKLYDSNANEINPNILNINDEKYILFDNVFVNTMKNSQQINVGLQNNILINISNISIDHDSDSIKLKLITELGNPVISNLFYRFYVKNMKINVTNGNNSFFFYSYVPENNNENIASTYLCNNKNNQNSELVNNTQFRYISKSIDVTFNPLSYIICPEDIETSYSTIYGDIYKYGIKEQIIKQLKFFNYDIYEKYNYTNSEIRDNLYCGFNNLNIKKSYIQDNIKKISVKPISIYSLLNSLNQNSTSLIIDDNIKTHNILDFIEGEKYLSIVYHSTLLQPRIRNGNYTFIYNDKEYDRSKYDQKINNFPIFAHDEQSIELRNDELINSMNKWNDWFAENSTNTINTYTGILSLYGNGYTQIINNDITLKNCLSLEKVKDENSNFINLYNEFSEVNIMPSIINQPNNNEYLRGPLYDINWEFPYYDNNVIIPYRIVSQFDNLLKNIQSSILNEYYQNYKNSLTNSQLYENRMIPYTLLYDIKPRIAYNYESETINVLMLRRPSIGIDTDFISGEEFNEKYEFNRRLFNLTQPATKLISPYTIK